MQKILNFCWYLRNSALFAKDFTIFPRKSIDYNPDILYFILSSYKLKFFCKWIACFLLRAILFFALFNFQRHLFFH